MKYFPKISILTIVFSCASTSNAEPWSQEFATERFGGQPSGFALMYSQAHFERGDPGRAVLELESILAAGNGDRFNYANLRTYLFRNPTLALDVFRATENRGINYYKCVFGGTRTKQLLKFRLDEYGDALSSSKREERKLAVEAIEESDQDQINTTNDCTPLRKAFTAGWTEEVDAIYMNNEKAIQTAELQYQQRMKEARAIEAANAERNKLEGQLALERATKKKQDALARLRPYSIAISNIGVYEYSTATGFKFSVLNLSKKTIKYVDLTLVGLNAVGDAVTDRLKGRRLHFQAIGPIEQNELARYSEDVMWFSDVVERAKVDSIKIRYMDGTTTSIRNPAKVILNNEEIEVLLN